MSKASIKAWYGVVFLAALAPMCRGDYPFEMSASSGGGAPITERGSRLLSLTDSLVLAQGPFAPFVGQAYTGSLSVGGVSNVLNISTNAAGTSITVSNPATGQSKTFTGATRAEARAKMDQALKNDLSRGLFAYQNVLQQQTNLGVVDGNPRSTSPLMATDAFHHFGLQLDSGPGYEDKEGGFRIGLQVGGGAVDADHGSGPYANADLTLAFRVCDRVSIVASLPFEWRQVGSADIYDEFGLIVGVPVEIIKPKADGIAWTVSPFGLVGGGFSEDLLNGGGLYGGGVASALVYRKGDFAFWLGDQISGASGFDFSYNGITYDTAVNGWILKNGVRAAYTPKCGGFLDISLTYSNLLYDAQVENYLTPEAGIGYQFWKNSFVRLGYSGDFANGFHDNGGSLTFLFTF